MKTIKTRQVGKSVKVHDKSISTSKRMKDAFAHTKEKAEGVAVSAAGGGMSEPEREETQYSSPSDYASDNIQHSARGTATDVAYYMKNSRQKARYSFERAKGHFQEVKRNLPKGRQYAAEQAANTAQPVKANAIRECSQIYSYVI